MNTYMWTVYQNTFENIQLFPYRTAFSEFAMKYGKDDRFKGIEKMKDRENLFVEFMAELKKKEKENSKMKQDKVGFLFPWGIRMDSRGNTSLMKFPLSVMCLDLDGVSDCFTVNVHPLIMAVHYL